MVGFVSPLKASGKGSVSSETNQEMGGVIELEKDPVPAPLQLGARADEAPSQEML